MPNNIILKPNVPLYVSLADPQGDSANFDFDLRVGRYSTTDGRVLALPEAGCRKLNELSPRPGEELQITKQWSGKAGEQSEWIICLSTKSENARAAAEIPDKLTEALEASLAAVNVQKSPVEPPTPIRRPAKSSPVPNEQPKLFDGGKGTGTYGPAPAITAPLPAIPVAPPAGRRMPPVQIPANIAVKEILAFIESDPNTRNWSADARQDLLSTVLIAAYKANHIGLWEREAK